MSEDYEPIRFRSQSEIDQMFEKLEERKKSRQASEDKLKTEYIDHIERRIAALKYVLTLSAWDVADLAHGQSSGYQETAADWLISKVDNSRMLGNTF